MQSNNNITYHRRLNVLGCIINSQYQMKSMLKEKVVLLQKHDSEFFEKKFRNHIADTIKSKTETREIFTDSKKLFQWKPSHPPSQSERQKVFLIKSGGSNYRKFNNSRSKFRQQTQTSQQRYGKCTFFKQNLLQDEFSCRNSPFFHKQSIFYPRLRNCLSFSKKLPQKIV